MAGISTTAAPRSSSESRRLETCSRARVTTILRPNSGRRSNQRKRSLSRATSPTTITVGGSIVRARSAMSASVPKITSCSGRVPQRITATVVAGARPRSTSARAMAARLRVPIMKASVLFEPATPCQSTREPAFEGFSCPAMKHTEEASSRCVRGMPA